MDFIRTHSYLFMRSYALWQRRRGTAPEGVSEEWSSSPNPSEAAFIEFSEYLDKLDVKLAVVLLVSNEGDPFSPSFRRTVGHDSICPDFPSI